MENKTNGWRQRIFSARGLVVIAAILALALFPVIVNDPYYTEVMLWIVFYAFLASAWNIIGGFAGQVSLGQAAFVGIGAYTSTLLFINLNISPWLGMFVGGLVAAVLSVLIGYPCFKLRGPYYVLVTLAFGELTMKVFENVQKVGSIEIRGASGLLLPLLGDSPAFFQFNDKNVYYWIILLLMLTMIYISYRIKHSKLGYYLEAIHNDEDAAEALGVDTAKVKLIAGAISAFACALGGTFYAQTLRYIDPAGVMGSMLSIDMALIAIIGGVGTVMGPVLGAFIIRPLDEITRTLLGNDVMGVNLMIFGAILILVIIYLPKGVIVPLEALFNRVFPPVSAKPGMGQPDYQSSELAQKQEGTL